MQFSVHYYKAVGLDCVGAKYNKWKEGGLCAMFGLYVHSDNISHKGLLFLALHIILRDSRNYSIWAISNGMYVFGILHNLKML